MVKTKVYCHSCNGVGFLLDSEYPTRKETRSVCPECNGKKYVEEELAEAEK